MSRQRLTPTLRKAEILQSAIFLAEEYGYKSFTRSNVASRAGCSEGLVTKYFPTINILRRAVVGAAISQENLNIIAQALVMGDPRARKAPENLRRQAAETLMGM